MRAMVLAAGLGAITLLVAGLVALVQTDIKRVIAYSTMSQIGYMFLGAGIGASSFTEASGRAGASAESRGLISS